MVIDVFRADLREETLAWTPVALRQALDRLWFQQIGPKLEQRPGRNERQLGLKTMLQRIDLFDQSCVLPQFANWNRPMRAASCCADFPQRHAAFAHGNRF